MRRPKWIDQNATWFILLIAIATVLGVLYQSGILQPFGHSSRLASCSGNCGLVTSVSNPTATNTPLSTIVPTSTPTIALPTPTPPITGGTDPTPTPTATPIPAPPPCPDTYHAGEYEKIIDQASPPNVHPGDHFSLYFTVCNDGSVTWSDAGGYKFQCDDVSHTQVSNGFIPDCMSGGQYGFGGTSVAPGQIFKFVLELVAPQQVGMYQTWWDMRNGSGGIIPNNNNYINVYVTN